MIGGFIFLGVFILLIIFLILWVGLNDYPSRKEKKYPKEYDKLLKRKEWQKKRLKILKRDNFECRYCRYKGKLNVHHKYYCKYPNEELVKPWDYPDDALITLCERCHKKVHERNKIKYYYRKFQDKFD